MEHMAAAAEFHISDLVRNPSQVIAHAERGDVILHRRGKADLRLALATRDRDASAVSESLARIIAGLARVEAAQDAIRRSMDEVYPWLRFLPPDGHEAGVRDLLDVAVSCAAVSNFAAYHAKVASWRSTAEIYSDPELYAKLSGPVDIREDLGPVPEPA